MLPGASPLPFHTLDQMTLCTSTDLAQVSGTLPLLPMVSACSSFTGGASACVLLSHGLHSVTFVDADSRSPSLSLSVALSVPPRLPSSVQSPQDRDEQSFPSLAASPSLPPDLCTPRPRPRRRLHLSHVLLSVLAELEDAAPYEELRQAYNSVLPEGALEAPAHRDWTMVGFCEHIFCR